MKNNYIIDNYTLELSSPITEEQWDMISDVDFDRTEHLWFHTKNGKEVHFYKDAIPIEWIEKWEEERTGGEYTFELITGLIEDWRKENESNISIR